MPYIRKSKFRDDRIPIHVTFLGDDLVLYTYKYGGAKHGAVSRSYFDEHYNQA